MRRMSGTATRRSIPATLALEFCPAMDIHPSHAPIRSVRDFLLQIFTVTCGIIIALGLEALIQWRADAALAHVTRADFKAEISANLDNLLQLRPETEGDVRWMLSMVAYGQAKLKGETAKPPKLIASRSFATMPKSAWDTALATQAIHRLSFQQARQLAETYNKQAALNDLNDQAEHQWFAMASYGADLSQLSEQDVRAALGAMRVSASYAASMLADEDVVISSYKAALREIAE